MSEVLFADDDPAMRQLVSDVLRMGGFAVRLAVDGRSALAEVRQSAPDLAVLDYRMGSMDGFELCARIKDDPRLEHIPVLILTAQGAMEHRVRAFEAGANDFLAKPFDPRELIARCKALLRLTRQALDRNPTTGLPGGETLRRELDRRFTERTPFALCYLDLDHFKPFHDRFGFVVADDVIRAAGRAIGTSAGDGDFVGHVGGDDFVLLTAPGTARSRVADAQARFRVALNGHVPPPVAAAGRFSGVDREGLPRDFPLTRLSAAIIQVEGGHPDSLTQFSLEIADAKRSAKYSADGLSEVRLPLAGAE